VGSALADRLLGLAALLAMGGVALVLAPPGPMNQLALTVFGIGLLIVVPAVMVAVLPDCARVLDSGYGERRPRLHAILACFPRYRTAPGLILIAFALSVLNQLLVVLALLVLAPKLGINISAVQLVVVLVLVFLVASLPISLGGLGPREGAMMGLLLPLGVDSASVLALSAVYLLVLWGSTLPGALMLLLREPKATNSTDSSAS
ncbi:MAG: lysylphosphatidylglycerol synthase domain-containing protein, partial [Gammaproteobacteria bacterium]